MPTSQQQADAALTRADELRAAAARAMRAAQHAYAAAEACADHQDFAVDTCDRFWVRSDFQPLSMFIKGDWLTHDAHPPNKAAKPVRAWPFWIFTTV